MKHDPRKKTTFAIALEMRTDDKELDRKFKLLPEKAKCEWAIFATNDGNSPMKSIEFCRKLVAENL